MAEPTSDAAFKRYVENYLSESLASRGYQAQSKRDLVFHLDMGSEDGIRGWLALDSAVVRGRYLDVMPTVGAHHPRLERVVAALRGADYSAKTVSVAEALGTLVAHRPPASPMWTFSRLDGLEEALDALLEAIDTHGRSYMASLRDRRSLAAAMRTDLIVRKVYRLPTLHLVHRRKRSAVWLARYYNVRFARGNDLFGLEYSAFVRRLVAYDARDGTR